jgi:hypothetical protein
MSHILASLQGRASELLTHNSTAADYSAGKAARFAPIAGMGTSTLLQAFLLCVNLHATFVGPQSVVSGLPEPTAASI